MDREHAHRVRSELSEMGVDFFDGETSGHADLGTRLNLNAMAIGLGLNNIEYEPGQFEGLVYYNEEYETTILVCGTGIVSIVDAPDERSGQGAVRGIVDRLHEIGILEIDSKVGADFEEADTVPVPSEFTS